MPASPSGARAINDRSALRLLRAGPMTAGQLTQQTGLSRPTVAELVKRLQEAGLVERVGEAAARRRGPNAQLYGIVRERAHLAALDVRTNGVAVIVSDLLGNVLAEQVLGIDHNSAPESAVARTVEVLEQTAHRAGAPRLDWVGIGAPGLVDPVTGVLTRTPGLPQWHGELATAIRERFTARVVLENETNLAALAELWAGAAADRTTFALLWLGHGTGAALVLEGKLHRGASGGAGELGFLPVPGNTRDPYGGFHALAASSAIIPLAAEHGVVAPERPHEPRAAGIVRAAVADGAGGFLDALADRVAIGVAAVTAVLDPGCVVLGGEVGHAGGTALAERVADRMSARSPVATDVRPSTLGGDGVLRGALCTARDAAQEALFG